MPAFLCLVGLLEGVDMGGVEDLLELDDEVR